MNVTAWSTAGKSAHASFLGSFMLCRMPVCLMALLLSLLLYALTVMSLLLIEVILDCFCAWCFALQVMQALLLSNWPGIVCPCVSVTYQTWQRYNFSCRQSGPQLLTLPSFSCSREFLVHTLSVMLWRSVPQ